MEGSAGVNVDLTGRHRYTGFHNTWGSISTHKSLLQHKNTSEGIHDQSLLQWNEFFSLAYRYTQ